MSGQNIQSLQQPETKELPLRELLRRIRNAAEDSMSVGYVTLPLANYVAELQAHSAMEDFDDE